MEPIKRLYKKDKTITRSLHIDEDLYTKLLYICSNITRNHIKCIQHIDQYCLEKSFMMN